MAPVVAFRFSPVGNDPTVTLHVHAPRVLEDGHVPASVWLYAVPSTPAGKVVVVIVGAGGRLTVMLRACVAVCVGLLLSAKATVKFDVPFGPVGVPVMAPALLRLSPAGSVPALVLQVHGPYGQFPTSVWLYAVPSTPAGRDVVVIVGAAGRLIVMLSACVADWAPAALESVTLTVKFDVLLGPVGVPVMAPALLKLRPAGKVPTETECVRAPAPPVTAIFWL
jgi:hypothetical protein